MSILQCSGLDIEFHLGICVCCCLSFAVYASVVLLYLTEAHGLRIYLDRRRLLELVFILVGLFIQFHWMPIDESLNCIDGCSMNYTCYYMFKY